MKIILSAKSVYPFHPVGGVQKYVYYFAKHLARKAVDVEIVAPLDAGKPREETFDGLKYTLLKPAIYRQLEYPIGWLGVHAFSRSLGHYLADKEFDLLHSFDLTGYQYARSSGRHKVIAHIFTDNYLCNPISLRHPFQLLNLTGAKFDRIKEQKVALSPFADWRTKAAYLTQYWVKVNPMRDYLNRVEAVFFEAEGFMEEVNRLYRLDPRKGRVIPVGTDTAVIARSLLSPGISRKEFSMRDNDIVLITVNRLAADKGVDKIVLALSQIVQEVPDVKLIIIGSGYQEPELRQMIQDRGLQSHVTLLKNIPEEKLYHYYRISDLYISAFSYPGSSVSTLEAMACGLPVVTTGQSWLVPHGENGVWLQDNSVGRIKDAVVGLVQQGRLRLKDQGQVSRDIVRDFDWDKITDEAIGEYERLLKRKAGAA